MTVSVRRQQQSEVQKVKVTEGGGGRVSEKRGGWKTVAMSRLWEHAIGPFPTGKCLRRL